MSKYGFDEKELRKTIVTMIDKDGFHKEIVTYGNEPYSPDDSGDKLIAEIEWNYSNSKPFLFAYNIPSERKGLHVLSYVHTTNAAYEFNIGQKITKSEAASTALFVDTAYLYRCNAFMANPLDAIDRLDPSTVEDNRLYYSVYLVRDEEEDSFIVIDRTKTISSLPV